MNNSTLPTKKAWYWVFQKPALSKDALGILYKDVEKEKRWRFYCAGFMWIIINSLFAVIGLSTAFYSFEFVIGQLYPIQEKWLQFSNHPVIAIFGIFFFIIGILFGACIGSVLWTYFMRRNNFINNAAIELIIREGPLLYKPINRTGAGPELVSRKGKVGENVNGKMRGKP